jgi:prophage regulatory protein
MNQQAAEPTVRIMRFREVSRVVGIPECSIRDLVSRGRFPKPVKLSTQAAGFFSDEIDAWMEELRGKRIQYKQAKPAIEEMTQ